MKRLFLVIVCFVLSVAGCTAPKNPPPSENISTNISTNLTSPWPGIAVYSDDTLPIYVAVGELFVIRYDYFAIAEVENQTAAIITLRDSSQITKPKNQGFPFDATTWFLFQAVAGGNISLNITETDRFGDPGPINKQFRVIVNTPQAGTWTDTTYIPMVSETVLAITGFSFRNSEFVRFSGSSSLPDGTTIFSQLFEDGKPCLWWPVDQPIKIQSYFWTISTPLGTSGAPAAMESGHDYLFVLFNESLKAERHWLVGSGPPANVTVNR